MELQIVELGTTLRLYPKFLSKIVFDVLKPKIDDYMQKIRPPLPLVKNDRFGQGGQKLFVVNPNQLFNMT